MKKYIIGLFLIISIASEIFAGGKDHANIISYDWKITNDNTINLSDKYLDFSRWDNINIGVSWERQGYFGPSGKLIIATQFQIPDIGVDYFGTNFTAFINLQCQVLGVYLNGEKISENLNFQSKSTNRIEIPANKLIFDGKNTLAILIDKVYYTGGVCNNEVRLTHPAFGNPETINVSVHVKDCLFAKEDDIVLNIHHRLNNNSKLRILTISDFHELIERKYVETKQLNGDIQVKLKRKLFEPGFYHVIVSTAPPFYEQSDIWIAVEPEKINCGKSEIADFDDWWKNTINELNLISPDIKVTKLESNDNIRKDVYELTFNSFENVLIHGFLFVPQKEGKFPAILHLPGYGMSYNERFVKNNEDVVELALCVRGHGLSRETINPGLTLPGIVGYKICDPNQYFYRGAYMDCLRAVDVLRKLPQVDSTRIAVMGSSQGGGLALATAALGRDKVKICVTYCPFLSDLNHHCVIREVFQKEKEIAADTYNCDMKAVENSLNYVDTKNMAHWITASVFYVAGLFDDDCPPHIGFATFNKIISEKTYKLFPEYGHILSPGNIDGRDFIKEKFDIQ